MFSLETARFIYKPGLDPSGWVAYSGPDRISSRPVQISPYRLGLSGYSYPDELEPGIGGADDKGQLERHTGGSRVHPCPLFSEGINRRVWLLNEPPSWQISTTKGTGGDIIILEEAAYIDPGFFYVSPAPLEQT